MNPEKDQVFVFNKDELSLIKNTFAENDTLLYTIRKVLFQFPLTDVEKGLIKQSVTPEVLAVLKKRMLPDIGPEFPLQQQSDIRLTLKQDLATKDERDMAYLFDAKQLEIDYLEQQFKTLEDLDTEQPIKLADLRVSKTSGSRAETIPANFVNMTAYLFLLSYLDWGLAAIKSIAGAKEETPEEQAKRMSQNSTK